MSCSIIERGVPCSAAAVVNVPLKKLERALLQGNNKLAMKTTPQPPGLCGLHREAVQAGRPNRRKRRVAGSDTKASVQKIVLPPNPAHNYPSPPSPVDEANIMDNLELELGHLQLGTLRRCRKFFNLQTRAGTNRQQLAENIIKHFRNMPVCEQDVIEDFIKAVTKRQPDAAHDDNER